MSNEQTVEITLDRDARRLLHLDTYAGTLDGGEPVGIIDLTLMTVADAARFEDSEVVLEDVEASGLLLVVDVGDAGTLARAMADLWERLRVESAGRTEAEQ